MKTLILASIFAIALRAQEPVQLIPQPANIGVWSVVQGAQASREHGLPPMPAVKVITLKGIMAEDSSTVCSVPLLEANTNANDPGIAVSPNGSAVPIRKAHVPAPPCRKE